MHLLSARIPHIWPSTPLKGEKAKIPNQRPVRDAWLFIQLWGVASWSTGTPGLRRPGQISNSISAGLGFGIYFCMFYISEVKLISKQLPPWIIFDVFSNLQKNVTNKYKKKTHVFFTQIHEFLKNLSCGYILVFFRNHLE